MKTTHTPEPWYVEKPYAEPGIYIACAGTSAILCKMSDADGRVYRDGRESIDANARLIASAPSLLCMLERLHDEVMTNEDCFKHVASLTLEHVRNAIAKAKGQP
jgi:hypothetical protein